MDDYRFRSQQSPRNETTMNSFVSPQRSGRPMPQATSQDLRSSLPRRFTTDSGRVPTLSTISSTSRLPEPQNYAPANPTQYKVQLLEKKQREYERVREQKRRFEAEMQRLDQQQRQDEMEMQALTEDLSNLGRGAVLGLTGHQSEPTTPPEYRETNNGFPTMFSRPNRYSMSSLVSPPGLFTNMSSRASRSGSVLQSPQSNVMPSRFPDEHPMPYRSVPGTRRNSDDDEKEEALRQDPTSHRSTNALNRYSLPVTKRGNLYDNIDQTNTTGFLFRDDDATMESGNYVSVDGGEDRFPQLHAQKGNPHVLSATSAAVDLASQLNGGEAAVSNGWGNISRHRQQQSLSTIPSSQLPSSDSISSESNTMGSRPYRHSIDINGQYKDASGETTPTASMSPANSQALSTPPKLQSSFSANDVPTMKNMPTAGGAPTNAANAHAQQHFHNHNASMGRIPPGAVPKRHSRELSSDSHTAVTQAGTFPSIQSQLQGGAPSFALPTTQGSGLQSPISPTNGGSVVSPGSYQYYNNYNQTGPNGNYGNNLVGLNGNYGNNPAAHNGTYGNNNNGMGALAMGMQHMNINAMNGINGMNGVNGMNGFAMSAAQQQYTGYSGQYQPAIQPRDSQQRVIAQRRAQNDETMSRFANHTLDDFQGQIYSLCKDQYGCRFLQKQLEGRNPDDTRKIWLETNQHVVELMTDPFGNYLCQKLLEYCTNDERTVLIQNAATDMVRIALNQHGTRALQKMIEHVSIPVHVQIIIEALRHNVVALIQDLNGNHVIQKCLNKLSSADADFIFDAVGHDCVGVGTHRHGCCVLQRCIDHADGQQKINLVNAITEHALLLVQDPFGNYVVQYIIDLNDPLFTEPLVRQFAGRICSLSRHKFSSNVVEKCLRCASDQSKDMMINELLVPGEADRLLKDSYGNYVIQTALDHSSPHMKDQLIKTIKDSLNGIKGTPYGRRLHAKIQQLGGDTSGSTTNPQKVPTDITQGQIGAIHDPQTAMASQSVLAPAIYTNGLNATRTSMSYPTTANIATIMPRQNHPNTEYQPRRLNPYQTYPGTGKNHTNGEGTFF